MNTVRSKLFVTADDRTGALEAGGVIACAEFTVPVGPRAEGRCCVVDIGSRHLAAESARQRLIDAHQREALHRCHKMDSGLRGNWPYEVSALADLGYRVAVVPSYPDAGRRCVGGRVFIHDVPVTQSAVGADPFNAPLSDFPGEILEATGCASARVQVWDANDNDELAHAISRCRAEGRVLVGPTGAIGAYAASVFGARRPVEIRLSRPLLIVCGSLSAVSREQIEQIDCPRFAVDQDMAVDVIGMLVTEHPHRTIPASEARQMAGLVAARVHADFRCGTLIVIGGDTAAAIVGDDTLDVIGALGTAIPVSRYRDWTLVTKGGGIGTRYTLVDLLSRTYA